MIQLPPLPGAPQLVAPFPYFGGKRGAVAPVWAALGEVKNYVEPFCGSAAVLLAAPSGKRIETVNDKDGFISNFWRSVQADADAVAHWIDWPVSEPDLLARHIWLVGQGAELVRKLHADPDYYDPKIAGWWCWGACSWIGSGWCEGSGPWVLEDGEVVKRGNAGRGVNRKLPHLGDAGRGVNRQLPHLGDAGRGVNRQLPHLGDAGQGVNRQLPHLGDAGQGAPVAQWLQRLAFRLRGVRVACGDWKRVITPICTTRHGLTGVFLDPPYAKGTMQYAAGGMGTNIAKDVQAWCLANGADPLLRIVLCGHGGEHHALLQHGWSARPWNARKGYALTDTAVANTASETLYCSPNCL